MLGELLVECLSCIGYTGKRPFGQLPDRDFESLFGVVKFDLDPSLGAVIQC